MLEGGVILVGGKLFGVLERGERRVLRVLVNKGKELVWVSMGEIILCQVVHFSHNMWWEDSGGRMIVRSWRRGVSRLNLGCGKGLSSGCGGG